MTAAIELPGAAEVRAGLRVASAASGLLMLLDQHRLTGRLPRDVQAQAARLRHAVKLTIQTANARPARPAPLALPDPDPTGALREWIAAQPWAQRDAGPQGWVYLLCFRDAVTGEHRPLRGNGCRGQYAGHYWGKPASSGLLKGRTGASGGKFAELAAVATPGGLVDGGEPCTRRRPPSREAAAGPAAGQADRRDRHPERLGPRRRGLAGCRRHHPVGARLGLGAQAGEPGKHGCRIGVGAHRLDVLQALPPAKRVEPLRVLDALEQGSLPGRVRQAPEGLAQLLPGLHELALTAGLHAPQRQRVRTIPHGLPPCPASVHQVVAVHSVESQHAGAGAGRPTRPTHPGRRGLGVEQQRPRPPVARGRGCPAPPRVHLSGSNATFPGDRSTIPTVGQESPDGPGARSDGSLGRDDANFGRSHAPTNFRLLQHRASIMRVVEPVLMAPLRRDFEAMKQRVAALLAEGHRVTARTPAERNPQAVFEAFLAKLRAVRVLDPACGSSNFLYLALQALKDLEREAILWGSLTLQRTKLPEVGPAQVLGIELNPYAAELARVVIWIGQIQWMLANGFSYERNPILQPLNTIECRDAILDLSDPEHPLEPSWPAADVVIGNPPFLGSGKLMRAGLGDEYVDALFATYRDRVPAGADLVCYWHEKARAMVADRKVARVGLLATQGIRGGANRRVLASAFHEAR